MRLFRWWHERVANKPFRPAVERLSFLGWIMVGRGGAAIRAVWRRLRRLPPASPLVVNESRRIIVIRPDRVGDTVLSTPALRALRLAAPQARITVITSSAAAALVKALTSVDDVVAVPGDRFIDWWQTRSALRRLRMPRPDLVVVLQSAWPAAWLAWWLGGVHRVGYDLYGMGWLLTEAVSYPFLKRKAHQVEVNLHLLQQIGVSVPSPSDTKLDVPVTQAGRRDADAWLQRLGVASGERLAIIHPGSRSRYTQWAPERFASVADRLAQELGYRVIVLCGPGEEAIVQRMVARMRTAAPVASQLPLATVIALLARCALFVGNATGTTHLASAVSPRVIAVIGGTHPHDCPERWGPWGPNHRVVHRSPEDTIGRSTWDWLGPEGLRFITPDDVMAAVTS